MLKYMKENGETAPEVVQPTSDKDAWERSEVPPFQVPATRPTRTKPRPSCKGIYR